MEVALRCCALFDLIQVNPANDDDWDADPDSWAAGEDQPFLGAVFAAMRSGEISGTGVVLDTRNMVVRGWSMGAAMVSWLFQASATGLLDPAVQFAGGIMLSGGSYMCCEQPHPVPSCPAVIACQLMPK